MFTDLENKNYSSQEEKDEILQLHNTLISLIVTIIPIFIVIVLTSMSVITPLTAGVIVVMLVLALYIYNLSFHLKLTSATTESDTHRHRHLHDLHRKLHSGPGWGSGNAMGLGNANVCPNGLPTWENYLRKYGLLYDDLGNTQSVPDDGIKYVVIEYNTPTSNDGVSLSEIQVWESTGTTSEGNEYVVSGLTNIAPQASVDVTKGFITENDPNNDLQGEKPDTCPSYNLPEDIYYDGNRPAHPYQHHNNYYGPRGHLRDPIDENHYNDNHDPTTHSHNDHNARPYYGSDHHVRTQLYNDHIEDHYREGMTTGNVKDILTNNNFSDQYLNIITDASSNTIVDKETLKMGLHTSKNHDELYAIRLITPTTLMNATVSLLNGNQEILYSKKIKETANVYTFKLSASGSEDNINVAIDDYDSSYKQRTYDVCAIPNSRRQYAIQHRANHPNNNMSCSTETFISTINLKNIMPKASPITRDLI